MKKTIVGMLALLALASSVSSCDASKDQASVQDNLVISMTQPGAGISESMFGIFFEEINHAGDGGLLAELVENKSFEDLEMPAGYHAEGDRIYAARKFHHSLGEYVVSDFRWTTEPVPGWVLEGDAAMSLNKVDPMFESAPNNLEVSVKSGAATLVNDGFWGMNIVEGEKYTLRTIIRTQPGFDGTLTARIISDSGDVLAEAPVAVTEAGNWNDSSITLVSGDSCTSSSLAIVIDGQGAVDFDYVSLMPENTFVCADGSTLPFRKDVAEMLAGLHPAFVRWPGGCVVEGISLENRFEWKKTLGDPAARSGEYSTWGYRCSYNFGFHEMLRFCESIGAGAMFVCNVGLGCQYRQGDLCTDEEIEYYLDDCLDAIEYALGPVDSEWGAKRAAAGHPDPFPLKYVEIGNENWGDAYSAHYNIFHKAIRAKYPELTLISNCRLGGIGNIEETDMIDPHWYVEPDFFFNNTHIFDDIERGSYTAYVGEYAANQAVGAGNMKGALSEAAFIGGMERNGDFVKMCSYAPLLENSNDRVWPVNLIWINSSQVLGRSSYYVQKMAAENRPDYNLATNITETMTGEGEEQTPAVFYACGYDKETSEVIVKVVNSLESPFTLGVSLEGAKSVRKTGKVIVLRAENLTDENSFDDPRKISPVESVCRCFSKDFSFTFAPCSYTVLRIPAAI